MKTIVLSDYWRIVRADARNWQTERMRSPEVRAGKGGGEPRWMPTGNYFGSVPDAAAFVYERMVGEGDGDVLSVSEFSNECRRIKNELVEALREAWPESYSVQKRASKKSK